MTTCPTHLKIVTPQAAEPQTPAVTPELVALARQQISGYVDDWPPPLKGRVIDLHTRSDRLLVAFHEGLNVAEVLNELRQGGPRPGKPITVLIATGIDSFQAAFADESDLRLQITGTEQLARAIARQGQPGEHHAFPDESHAGLPMRRPDAVADAIIDMLRQP